MDVINWPECNTPGALAQVFQAVPKRAVLNGLLDRLDTGHTSMPMERMRWRALLVRTMPGLRR